MGKVGNGGGEIKKRKKKNNKNRTKNKAISSPLADDDYLNNNNNNSKNKNNNNKNNSVLLIPNLDTNLETDSDSDDDVRKQKKLKLVLRLPSSDNDDDDVVVKDEKETEALQGGSPLESGPTALLPDKKYLVFILDRLQKKDTYGVFSEPVDPNELPDYHEIIEHPMDFGKVRRKLEEGSYSNLDDFESDVNLICANAMQYNGSDSVYYRQAKSIQDIAKRDFYNLRQVNEEGEPQPRIVRRGRPPNLFKALSTPPIDRVAPESSSGATPATAEDNNNINNDSNNNNNSNTASYNLRKAVPSLRFQSSDAFFKASPQPRSNETYADYSRDWNSEFPAKILKAEAKYGKKQFPSDEKRRHTYKNTHSSAFVHDPSSLASLNGNMKQLIGVGLYSDHGYARSLARFAANLGPVVWKIASKKIEKALPGGVNFGPGWVGVNEILPLKPQPSVVPSTNLVHDNNNSYEQAGPSESIVEQSLLSNSVSVIGSGPILEAQQKQLLQNRNGLNQLSGLDFSAQADMLRARLNLPQQFGGSQESRVMAPSHSTSQPIIGVSNRKSPQSILTPPAHENVQSQQQHIRPSTSVIPIPPDLNVRFQAPGSPSSRFRISSPQPDLALQL